MKYEGLSMTACYPPGSGCPNNLPSIGRAAPFPEGKLRRGRVSVGGARSAALTLQLKREKKCQKKKKTCFRAFCYNCGALCTDVKHKFSLFYFLFFFIFGPSLLLPLSQPFGPQTLSSCTKEASRNVKAITVSLAQPAPSRALFLLFKHTCLPKCPPVPVQPLKSNVCVQVPACVRVCVRARGTVATVCTFYLVRGPSFCCNRRKLMAETGGEDVGLSVTPCEDGSATIRRASL